MSDNTYDSEQIIGAIGGISPSGPAMNAVTNSISVSGTPAIALTFNFRRKSFMVWNSTAPIYIKLGINLSGSSFSFILNAGKYFGMDDYGGPVMVQAVDADSNIYVTELS